jgi:Uri superfamily endonuclease
MVHREENNEPRVGLPPLPGTYVLVLRFSKRLEIVVGKLGVLAVQPGFYVYVGSALGPGGLAARVGRHCRHEKTARWHVDYLRAAADLEEVWYATGKSHRECRWASVLRALPGASVPLGGFGASDCGCPSHLCFFSLPPSLADFRKKLLNRRIGRLRLAAAEEL